MDSERSRRTEFLYGEELQLDSESDLSVAGEQDTVLQLTAFTEGDESATVILSVASMEYSIGS